MKRITRTLVGLFLIILTLSCSKEDDSEPAVVSCELIEMYNVNDSTERLVITRNSNGYVSAISEVSGNNFERNYSYFYNTNNLLDSMVVSEFNTPVYSRHYSYTNGKLNEVNTVEDADTFHTFYTYNTDNSVKEITGGSGQVRKFEYDQHGNLLAVKLFYGASHNHTYKFENYDSNINPFKDIRGLTGFSGEQILYQLRNGNNNPGKISSIQHYHESNGTIRNDFDYAFTYQYTYNVNGLPEQIQITDVAGNSKTLKLTYTCN